MMTEGYGSGSRAGSGSGSIPLTSGSGSGRPKNVWIRIRNTGFEPPGFASGSVGPKYGGSVTFHHQAKIVRKTNLDFYCFVNSS
jgi:hypothetical protein